MKSTLLVGGPEFIQRLGEDLGEASSLAYVQALTFEADAAGRAVAELLLRSPAADRRLIVDHFSNHVVSDRLLWRPRNLLDPVLRQEVRATRDAIHGLRVDGVGVRYVNPVGPLFLRFPARNHKKLVVVDDRVAYIGGINFSDHNFAWHDLMIRIECPRMASFLRDDFLATWAGRNQGASVQFDSLTLHVFDGARNETRFARVFERLAKARHRVFVQCPYVTDPFRAALVDTARRGVEVTLLVPEENNWQALGHCLAAEAVRGRIDVRFFPGMTHMKAMLIDDEVLLVGSANFDLVSYHFQQEYLAEVSDPDLLSQFRARVVEPDLACALRTVQAPPARSLQWAQWKVAAAQRLAAVVKGGVGVRRLLGRDPSRREPHPPEAAEPSRGRCGSDRVRAVGSGP